MIRRICLVSGLTMLLGGLIAGSGAANVGADPTSYDSTVTARYRSGAERFVGSVSSVMPASEVERTGNECVNDREVSLFRQRPSGALRLVGSSTTSEGRWKIERSARAGTYVAKVEESEFTYAPEYGELEVIVCEAASFRLKVKPDQVLGIRVSRGGALPVTGPSVGLFTLAGIAQILAGMFLIRRSRDN